jgi:proprotein convertase subtilisin/kexin type 5
VSSSNNCILCTTNYFLFNSTCINACPTQYYGDASFKVCMPCIRPCYSCLNSSYCLTCSSNFGYNGSCVNSASCPTSNFADITSLSCIACNSLCLTCRFSATFCTSCNSTSSTPLLQNNTCVASCSSTSTYPASVNGGLVCVACISPC